MEPVHGVSAQTSTPPYNLILSKYTYSPGEKITVTLRNTSANATIEGFMIQARDASSSTPLGYFEVNNTDVQTLKCTTDASAVTHKSSTEKTNIQVTWVAPNATFSNIRLRATVVQNGERYWKAIVSEKLAYSGSTGYQSLVPGFGQILLYITVLSGALCPF
ncbi:putative ferric-chelate reductase 1 [Spea bombifrons]|uniref:putative ferric-chelate reductase 1 n=1 Tax=Spea bombifrons TaxID=233779 RepID=UPI00234AB852|nr:putative ferric-chelate reductase 1 [Spea bombifrons]